MWLSGTESTCSAGNPSSIPRSGRSPGGGNGNPLHCCCLENPIDWEAWRATVHGVAKTWTRLSSEIATNSRDLKVNRLQRLAQFSSVAQSCPTLRPHESQHARPPCPSPTPRVHSDSRSLSRWCHPAISSSVIPFSSCPQSLPASESFPMSQLFTWGGQSFEFQL